MRRKTSFKTETLKQILRQAGWVSIAYFLALAFTLPFQVLRRSEEGNAGFSMYPGPTTGDGNPLFDYGFEMQYPFTLLAPLLMGIFLFRFLQNRGYSDFIHSLPMKRIQLFVLHVSTGLVLLVLPLLLNAALLSIFLLSGDPSVMYGWKDLGEWAGLSSVLILLIYSVSVFTGMLTGMSLLQGAVAFVLLVLPEGLLTLITSNLTFYWEGFTPSYYMSAFSQEYSPVLQLFSLELGEVSGFVIGCYAGIAALFLIAAYLLYKFRPLEMAGQAVSFPKAAPFFQYLIVFCFMLAGGLYFASGTWSTWGWLIFGYFVGSLFGFLITQMLLEKTWRIFSKKTLKNYFIYAGISVTVIFLVYLDPFGYEEKVPTLEEVESVYIGDHHYRSTSDAVWGENMTGTENILRVMKVHEHLMKETAGNREGRSLFLEYELENGETIARSYVLPHGFDRQAYLKELYESKEYKQMSSPLFQTDPDEVERVEFMSRKGSSFELSDPEVIVEFYRNAREDVSTRTYEQMVAPQVLGTDVLLYPEDRESSQRGVGEPVHISLSDENTVDWMKEEGIYEQVFLDAEQIDELKIVTMENAPGPDSFEEFRQKAESGEGVETVTDPARIREIVTSSLQRDPAQKMVGIYFSSSVEQPADVYGLKE